VDVRYHGLDYTPEMVELGRAEIGDYFELGAIEDLAAEYDNVLCFNVLTNSPHYALPLERLLHAARRRIVLRESLGGELIVRYTPDPYLDEGARHIRVYHNQYPIDEVMQFMREHGFAVTTVVDRRSNDGVEMVVDIPHRWRILVGERA
jgi:SAM-dependent methyltransferase